MKKRNPESDTLNPVPCPLSPEKAFTLIELLVAASILGLIGLAILTTFGSGFRVYERLQSFGGVQADALLSLEEMEKNLRNIFPFSGIGFEGDAQGMAFPKVIDTLETVGDEEGVVSSVGRILYYLDEAGDGTKALMSRQQDYPQAVAEPNTEGDQGNTLAVVEDMKLSYYFFDEEAGGYGWKDSWIAEDGALPAGVKVELTFRDGSRDVRLTRTVLIPAGREDQGG